jgi:putative membrane protein
MLIARRAALKFALTAVPAAYLSTIFVSSAQAVDALPDARFVGWAQTFNDYEIAAGRLAVAKSGNEIVRGFGTRMIAEHTEASELLRKSRAEAGVSYAPDPSNPPNTVAVLQRLNALEGPQFDTAYANSELASHANAVDQLGAYSQSGDNGALRRYAQAQFSKAKEQFEYAKRMAGGVT